MHCLLSFCVQIKNDYPSQIIADVLPLELITFFLKCRKKVILAPTPGSLVTMIILAIEKLFDLEQRKVHCFPPATKVPKIGRGHG